jgi:hypothetical protein
LIFGPITRAPDGARSRCQWDQPSPSRAVWRARASNGATSSLNSLNLSRLSRASLPRALARVPMGLPRSKKYYIIFLLYLDSLR